MVRIAGMRIVYLSPHLDDAILSAGGLIRDQADQGRRVEIWTLMSGVPGDEPLSDFAKTMHAEWGTSSGEETLRVRRAEDRLAAALVGATTVHFEFLDCLYRRDEEGSPLYQEALHTPIHPSDAALPSLIAHSLSRRLQVDDTVICQLGIGEHVDHMLVRAGAERLQRELLYVADLPYLFSYPEELGPKTVSLEHSSTVISSDGLRAWLKAIDAYRSQLSSVFESVAGLHAKVREYASREGGFRIWVRPIDGHSGAGTSLVRPSKGLDWKGNP